MTPSHCKRFVFLFFIYYVNGQEFEDFYYAPSSNGDGSVIAVDKLYSDNPPRPKEVKNWPKEPLNVGQITAVSINTRNQPVIFHRAERVWDESSFNESFVFQQYKEGPILENTILVLDDVTGAIIESWGGNFFYMPHGLTVDSDDNIWVTDVAMHQVFKYVPNHKNPRMALGKPFRAGNIGYSEKAKGLLCMPTSVAVATTGEIFVADGYCNNQILKFNAAGGLLRVIPRSTEFLSLQIPHSLTLLEGLDMVCVADRENMRVVCPRAGIRSSLTVLTPAATIQEPDLGRVFAVAGFGDIVYAVNGPTSPIIPVRGFTIDPRTEKIIDHWGPESGLTNPHSIAVSQYNSTMYITEIGPNKLWKFNLYLPEEKQSHD